jgi:hypothetical protein
MSISSSSETLTYMGSKFAFLVRNFWDSLVVKCIGQKIILTVSG